MIAHSLIEINDLNISSLQSLADEALLDEEKFIQRTIDEWKSGANTFSKTGEKFWAITIEGEFIACGGLNQDPYTSDKAVGRVRHVYVCKRFRRLGYSKILLRLIMDEAKKHFGSLRLYTDNPIATLLYGSLGFENIDEHKATHILRNLRSPN